MKVDILLEQKKQKHLIYVAKNLTSEFSSIYVLRKKLFSLFTPGENYHYLKSSMRGLPHLRHSCITLYHKSKKNHEYH